MAVELAKVSLWLHTFTVGAPLSFLDHHLRCGNSLYGEMCAARSMAGEARHSPDQRHHQQAKAVTAGMEKVEALTDADIAEVKESEANFGTLNGTRPIAALLDFIHVLRWQDPKDEAIKRLVNRFLDGNMAIRFLFYAADRRPTRTLRTLCQCRQQIAEQRFLHWEVAFPGVWSNWEGTELQGGFDAVIGNPPWDRIKFQEVEWFAARKPESRRPSVRRIARRWSKLLRKRTTRLRWHSRRPLPRAESAAQVARTVGDYPLLSGGDINIYSLFVERGTRLIKPEGLVGLLTPSGIASDKTASRFFKSVATTGRLGALFDFENKGKCFSPMSMRHLSFVRGLLGAERNANLSARIARLICYNVGEIDDPERSFVLTPL